MKVLVSDSVSDRCVQILKNAPGVEVDVNTKLKPEELKKVIKNYHALVVRSATKVTAEIIEAADNLKVIGRAGTGVDNIDTAAATKKGIVVMNTPGGNTITTAEHAVAMLVALARKIPQATASMRKGEWEKKKFEGTEITGKTLGILGVGNIGSVVAERAQGLRMNVLAYDPYLSQEAADRMGVEMVSLDELYKRSDFISVHVPLTNETKNLVNKTAFSKMKRGVKLINCARGGIVNEKDLLDAIKEGIVSGAALDVFEKEPTPQDNPLLGMEEVILTPHLGASTFEAQENVAIAIAEQIADYLVRGTIRNAVNVPSVPAELLTSLSPYITLSEKLGSLQGQMLKGAIEEVTIEYSGDVVSDDVAPVTIAAIKGLLDRLMDQPVNFVNKEPRIVRIDKFFLDAIPEGNLLILYNYDKPGVIGNVGTLLASGNINIARLHLGRQAVGGEAVSVWNIDTPLPQEVLVKLLKLPHIISAKVVEL